MSSDTATARKTLSLDPDPGPEEQARVEEPAFAFQGFSYRCRVVRQDAPHTEPLLILGGSSQNRHAWIRHEKWLTPWSTLVTVDLPGYGEADFLPSRYGLDFLAGAVDHLLTTLGMDRVNLLGACFGGGIALRFAQARPDRVARLAFAGMAASVPDEYARSVPRWLGMLERGERAEFATELIERFMSPLGSGRVRKHSVVSRLLYQQFMGQSAQADRMSVEHIVRLMNHEWMRHSPVPAVPALVMTGEHDSLCTPAMGREFAAALPGASFFTTIKETDHLVSVERMAEFSDLLARFCTDRPITGLPYCTPVERMGRATGPLAAPPRPAPGRTGAQAPARAAASGSLGAPAGPGSARL
ncbi:alpha/beta fold hydrolase [Streptomyces sp. NPDC018031]|uniref:alpha/beta fold hydrolase n=1 Tax=Streptomyces sp. NPDC018031 TaxID=3365033 RepID=UPI0037B3494D